MNDRQKTTRRLSLFCGIASSMVWSGCGGTYDAYVRGVATLDGAALPSGTVSFLADQSGPASYGVILNDGSYVVNTGREAGLPSGGYTVTVVAREKSIADTSGRGLPPKAGQQITPPWYGKKKSSPLKFTVEPGKNNIDLQLSTEPPPDWKPPKPRRR